MDVLFLAFNSNFPNWSIAVGRILFGVFGMVAAFLISSNATSTLLSGVNTKKIEGGPELKSSIQKHIDKQNANLKQQFEAIQNSNDQHVERTEKMMASLGYKSKKRAKSRSGFTTTNPRIRNEKQSPASSPVQPGKVTSNPYAN